MAKKPEVTKLPAWELLKPFASRGELDAATQAFINDADLLRHKHRLPHVVVIVQGTAMVGDREGEFFSVNTLGNHIETAVVLVAQALGTLREKLNERIGVLRYPR